MYLTWVDGAFVIRFLRLQTTSSSVPGKAAFSIVVEAFAGPLENVADTAVREKETWSKCEREEQEKNFQVHFEEFFSHMVLQERSQFNWQLNFKKQTLKSSIDVLLHLLLKIFRSLTFILFFRFLKRSSFFLMLILHVELSRTLGCMAEGIESETENVGECS